MIHRSSEFYFQIQPNGQNKWHGRCLHRYVETSFMSQRNVASSFSFIFSCFHIAVLGVSWRLGKICFTHTCFRCYKPSRRKSHYIRKKYRVVSHLQMLQGQGPHVKKIQWFTRFNHRLECWLGCLLVCNPHPPPSSTSTTNVDAVFNTMCQWTGPAPLPRRCYALLLHTGWEPMVIACE